MRRFALAVTLAVGCSKEAPVEAHTSVAPVASLTSYVAPPAPEKPIKRTASFVAFEGDRLDACIDAVGLVPRDAVAKFEEGMIATGEKVGATRIQKTCGEQFSDRSPQASCFMRLAKNDNGSIALNILYYSTDSVDSDAKMKECLQQRGDWQSYRGDPKAARERVRMRADDAIRRMSELTSEY